MAGTTRSLDQQLDHVARRLVAELTGSAAADEVLAVVHGAAAQLAGARVTQYVPVLVDRAARNQLLRGRATHQP
ncbi:MAG: three-helix bundle dimerization domain-containing protein [Frankiaceae bacterium]